MTPIVDEAAIFQVARQIAPGEVRRLYLEQVCGPDAGLRARLESLLRVHDEDQSFLAAPAEGVPTLPRLSEGPGTQIGAYKLLEKIGEGGFGVVFMAEQRRPVQRRVALKIIKPGMDTAQVVARFESERQALALMVHPNIAQIYDGGATESGRPYFVMELVRGVPITEFCDKNHLPAEERLKLFVTVCHAIQHAHHKGVIHRDIKPSNVLITLHDGVPAVKIIDFGIAKAIAQRLTEKTLFTGFGQMIGTPIYMSPEQAEMSGLDVDTRSDIYSLGVLLYELLTGTTPLDAARLREAGYAEMQRLIREEEPQKPSTRLSSLGDSATILAGNRATDPKQLSRLLAGDLDWIVMTSLEKDRNRRYTTPGSFAEDIERYLRREAILARPPSALYRVKKFAQRHRVSVTAAIAVAVALLTGTTLAVWQAVVATRAKDTALRAASAESAAKVAAETREAETQAILNFVRTRILAAARPKGRGGLGTDVTLRAALEAALPFVQQNFAEQPLIQAQVRTTLGDSFYYLADQKGLALGVEQFKAAREIYSQHADEVNILHSMAGLANCYRGMSRYADALPVNQEIWARRKIILGQDHPDTLKSMSSVAGDLDVLGRPREAVVLYEQALEAQKTALGTGHLDTITTMYNLALCYEKLHRDPEVLTLRRQTLDLARANLGPSNHLTLRTMGGLADSYTRVGRHEEAQQLREDAVKVLREMYGPDHRDTLKGMFEVAAGLANLGKNEAALKLHQEAFKLQNEHLGAADSHTLLSMGAIARNLVALKRGGEALPVIDDCLRLGGGNPVIATLLPDMMELRSRHFESIQDSSGCRATAEMWERFDFPYPVASYYAARFRAVTAAVQRIKDKTPDGLKQADAEADKAMVWLQKAVAGGYGDAARLKQEKDFASLRDRPDFKKLLGELEARTPKDSGPR